MRYGNNDKLHPPTLATKFIAPKVSQQAKSSAHTWFTPISPLLPSLAKKSRYEHSLRGIWLSVYIVCLFFKVNGSMSPFQTPQQPAPSSHSNHHQRTTIVGHWFGRFHSSFPRSQFGWIQVFPIFTNDSSTRGVIFRTKVVWNLASLCDKLMTMMGLWR